jgi:hypothetical protein
MPIIEDEQDQQNLEKEENPVLEEDVSEEETQENDKTD